MQEKLENVYCCVNFPKRSYSHRKSSDVQPLWPFVTTFNVLSLGFSLKHCFTTLRPNDLRSLPIA